VTAPLAAALRAAAAGILHHEEATGLLIAHAAFLHRDDFTARFTSTAASIPDGTPIAWISSDDAIIALTAGQIPASSGEARMLRLAAGSAVSLRDTIPSLDQRNSIGAGSRRAVRGRDSLRPRRVRGAA
jgi:hypothetical protein